MANSEINRVKAFVLLDEEEYLKENIRNPVCYFPSLKKHNILTEEQCQEIRNIADFKAGIVRLVELISARPGGFDVFSTVTRKNRADNHIASYLKRKVSETSLLLESPTNNSDLTIEQRQTLKLMEFLERTDTTHEVARDILQNKLWDVGSALEAARDMGLWKKSSGSIVYCGDDSPRSSNGYSIGDSGEYEFSSLDSSTTNSSARSSSSDLPLTNNEGVYVGYHSEVGPLPLVPTANNLPSPKSPVTNEVHPQHGVLPQPLHSPTAGGESVRTEPLKTGGQAAKNSARPLALSSVPSVAPPSKDRQGSIAGGKSRRPTTLPTGKNKPQANVGIRPGVESKPEPCKSKKPDANKAELFGRNSSPACRAEDAPGRHVGSTPVAEVHHQKTGPYWVCYHCHEQNYSDQNYSDEVICKLCKMLYCLTHPSWDADDDSESKNYICKECTLPVRIPCKPCPPTLVSCLQNSMLCNKCYRATCRSKETPHNSRPMLALSTLAAKPTLLMLRSMQDEDGDKICIIDEVAPRWDSLAPQIGIPNSQINILRRDCPSQCQMASQRMFSMWVDGPDVSWKMLLGGLKSINENVLAVRIEQACECVLPQEK